MPVDTSSSIDTITGVESSDGQEVPAASDDDVEVYDQQVDVNSNPVSETISIPDRSGWIVVAVDDANGDFHVDVEFQASDATEVITRDQTTDSALSGGAGNPVLARIAVITKRVDIRIEDDSGASNTLDYAIYAGAR